MKQAISLLERANPAFTFNRLVKFLVIKSRNCYFTTHYKVGA